jgi:sugar lactone lactonase YvrE
VYVADSQNNRVEKFSSSGQYITSWATPGVGSGPPVRPQYLAVDAGGNVYVSTAAAGQVVEKFSPSGQLLATWR